MARLGSATIPPTRAPAAPPPPPHPLASAASDALRLAAWSRVSLGQLAKVLVALMLATAAAKVALQGRATMPTYARGALPRIFAYFAISFFLFALPSRIPGTYWLFHSLWCTPTAQLRPSSAALLLVPVPDDMEQLAPAGGRPCRLTVPAPWRARRHIFGGIAYHELYSQLLAGSQLPEHGKLA